MSVGTPRAEVAIDQALVQRLLEEQHPDLARLPLAPMDSGWDNVMYRLGDAMAVRMPRRAVGAALVEREQAWLPKIAPSLPFPVPAPLRVGAPGGGYPWRWSVVPWMRGHTADKSPPDAAQAMRLGAFLDALHVPAPENAPLNPMRGVPLATTAASFMDRVERLKTTPYAVSDDVMRIWREALEAPIDIQPTWIHGDLHSRNVLVDDGAIAGVIDWGDMARGDRATDLAAIWMLFDDSAAREAVRRSMSPVSDATWTRAKGWAARFGVLLLESGLHDHPAHAAIGKATLSRLTSSPASRE